jgi:hypothetical protein
MEDFRASERTQTGAFFNFSVRPKIIKILQIFAEILEKIILHFLQQKLPLIAGFLQF